MNFIQYIKQAWKAGTSGGTPLSPDRLNHMEDGIKNNNDMISKLNNNIDRFYQKSLESRKDSATIKIHKSDPYASMLILVCNNSSNGAIFLSSTFDVDVIQSNNKCSVTFVDTKNFTIQCSQYNKLFFISNSEFSVSIS